MLIQISTLSLCFFFGSHELKMHDIDRLVVAGFWWFTIGIFLLGKNNYQVSPKKTPPKKTLFRHGDTKWLQMFTNVSLGEECQEVGRGSCVLRFPKRPCPWNPSASKRRKRPSFCLFETENSPCEAGFTSENLSGQMIFDFRKHEFKNPQLDGSFLVSGPMGISVISGKVGT